MNFKFTCYSPHTRPRRIVESKARKGWEKHLSKK
jgi:hypothetical protein